MQAVYRVGSVANAARAKRILEAHGVRAFVKRHTDSDGCGYAVMVTTDSPFIVSWLQNGGVTVYR